MQEITPLPDTSKLNRDTIKRALRLSPDAADSDVNTALLKMLAMNQGQSPNDVEPGGPNLDGDLLRQVIGNPDASDDEVSSTFEALADQTNPMQLETLSAATPTADLRFKSAASRTADDDAELIRLRLGISREDWNKAQ